MRNVVLFLIVLPWTLTISYPAVLILWAARQVEKLRFDHGGILSADTRGWLGRKWKYSTTLGYGMVYRPGRRPEKGEVNRIWNHEMVHTRQIQDLMLLSLIIGAIVGLSYASFGAFLCIWWSGGAWQLPNFVSAWLRGGRPYRDSEHERAAYSFTDTIMAEHIGKTWQTIQHEARTKAKAVEK